jgi:hypothetical protein
MRVSLGRIFKPVKAEKPKANFFNQFIGRTLTTMSGERVLVERCVGSMVKPTRLEINGTHHVVILDAMRQITPGTGITDEDVQAFDEMVHHVEKIEPKQDAGPIAELPQLDKE